ncbi:MAG: copper-binding protein, partial [Acidobacteriota bacterium]|nr:copper-binding protein [Acidobacteriota bacterium]
MGKSLFILAVSVLALNAPALNAQDQPKEPAGGPKPKAYSSLIGEVTAIDPGAKQLTLKTGAGTPATVLLDEKTLYLKVPPGEKDLKKAAKITLSDVAVGDRVAARVRNSTGENAQSQSATPAVSVMVMTKAELAQHHEKNREEWVRRGVAGKVDAIDPANKQITIKVQTPAGLKDVIVAPVENVIFRRYAPDSVRFADATPSTFADLKVGDNMRVLGDKSEDGTRIKPEEIVSGTFRNIAGTVLSVDAATGQLKITDLSNKKPLTIKVSADTTLKKLAPEMAARIARMRQGGGPADPGGPGGGPPPGVPAG